VKVRLIFPVRITSAAWRDIEEIYDWIAEHDSPAKAEYVLDRLQRFHNCFTQEPQT
jgi:plasmid stabilization system protein ParE